MRCYDVCSSAQVIGEAGGEVDIELCRCTYYDCDHQEHIFTKYHEVPYECTHMFKEEEEDNDTDIDDAESFYEVFNK